MHLPTPMWKINVWSVGTTIFMGAFMAGVLWTANSAKLEKIEDKVENVATRVTALDDRGRARSALTDGNFKAINDQLNDLPYRTQLLEEAMKELRADRARRDEILNDKLDKIITSQARTDTKVEVVSSQVEDLKKSVANKIMWKDGPLFPIPWIREVSLKPCYLPTRAGYIPIKAHYRVDTRSPVTMTAH